MTVFEVHDEITLHQAMDESAESDDVDNLINIVTSPINISAEVELDNSFNANRKLTIRPRPGMRRATIASTGFQCIFIAGGAGHVTFQDLDIVRNITNKNDLVVLSGCNNITIERCRIGSISQSAGSQCWSNLRITRPTDIVVRNSIFFAYRPGTFDYGIRAEIGIGEAASLLLYNNVVADYKEFGIHVKSLAGDGFLLLRNNVVANHSGADPEPVAYYSHVDDGMTVVTSHGVAFASVGQVETVSDGCQSISGESLGVHFLRRARAQVDAAFVEHTWVIIPAWDPNLDFFRLVRLGPLHNRPAHAGQNIQQNGAPHKRDVAVTDDIEKDPRPAGIPLHTDRGADQILHDDTFLDLGMPKLPK